MTNAQNDNEEIFVELSGIAGHHLSAGTTHGVSREPSSSRRRGLKFG